MTIPAIEPVVTPCAAAGKTDPGSRAARDKTPVRRRSRTAFRIEHFIRFTSSELILRDPAGGR
jgi:hypothetical protein